MEVLTLPELSAVITVIIYGAGLACFFFLLRKLIDGLKASKKIFSILNRVRPVFEAMVWCAFLFWSVFHLFQSQPFLAYAIYGAAIVCMGLSSWFAIKEAVIGVIFKLEQHIQIGDRIRTGVVHGVVQRIGYRYLEIKTDSRQVAILPYSELARQVFVKIGDASVINTQTLTLDIPKNEDLQQSMKKIKTLVYNSMWVSLQPEPQINVISEKEAFYTINITIAILSPDYFTEIEQIIKKEMIKT